jgi:hypothetical protein
MARGGKVPAVRKTTEKQAARRKAKEERLQRASEKLFKKSLQKYEKTSFESERQYLDGQLTDNPKWVRPLAELIRHGALNVLLKLGEEDEDDVEAAAGVQRRWKGKAKTFGELPLEVKMHMLDRAGMTIDIGTSEDIVTAAFVAQFFVEPEAPLPAAQVVRLYATIDKMVADRLTTLGVTKPLVEKITADTDVSDLELWTLSEDGSTLDCALCPGQSCSLPSLGKESWDLADSGLPGSVVRCSGKATLAFSCRSLFDALRDIDPEKKWDVPK